MILMPAWPVPVLTPYLSVSLLLKLCDACTACTCSDAVLERVSAVHQDLLQRLRLVRQLQVEALHALQELVRVMEIQHFGGSVEGLPHIVGEDLHHLQKKLDRGFLAVFSRQ